jgi:hypothetical protein
LLPLAELRVGDIVGERMGGALWERGDVGDVGVEPVGDFVTTRQVLCAWTSGNIRGTFSSS